MEKVPEDGAAVDLKELNTRQEAERLEIRQPKSGNLPPASMHGTNIASPEREQKRLVILCGFGAMSKKIMVVDNHPLILQFLGNLLEKEGHHVLTAKDGLSALEAMKTFVPDIVFVDLIMPNISGKRLCRIMRKRPHLKDIYIVILSAVAAEEQVDVVDFGANVFTIA